jgi:hypothetical protein
MVRSSTSKQSTTKVDAASTQLVIGSMALEVESAGLMVACTPVHAPSTSNEARVAAQHAGSMSLVVGTTAVVVPTIGLQARCMGVQAADHDARRRLHGDRDGHQRRPVVPTMSVMVGAMTLVAAARSFIVASMSVVIPTMVPVVVCLDVQMACLEAHADDHEDRAWRRVPRPLRRALRLRSA